jgi:hypothetical protein
MLNFMKIFTLFKSSIKYEKLLLQIDEARFKRTNMQIQYAMMMLKGSFTR